MVGAGPYSLAMVVVIEAVVNQIVLEEEGAANDPTQTSRASATVME